MAISRAKRFQKKIKRKETNSTGGRGKFKRGFYNPINEGKYKLPQNNYMNSQPLPEYRSSWELKMYKWMDMNTEVEYWSTEPFAIEYISPKDGQKHRYFPDVLMKLKDGRKYLIEIKPNSQWDDPINVAKWEQAEKFCKLHNLIWQVMGEKELGIKK